MPSYTAPIKDMQFVLHDVLNVTASSTPGYDELEADFTSAILEEAGKLTSEVLAPLNAVGDQEGCRLENGVVYTPKGFKDAFAKVKEGGWTGLDMPEQYGGQNMPYILGTAVGEMFSASNQAFTMYQGLTHGAASAILAHGSDAQKDTYLPNMVSCEWTGTMNLTEPHCGTDLGLMRTKAAPQEDGSYKITGQKIFISSGEHDMADNIIHLVLAKIEGGPEGIKGVSLFIVPKFMVEEDGSLGERNAVSVGSIEEKMGIHGNSTCVMNYDGAVGYLLGDEHKGMRAMFTMMNNARLGVGIQGIGIAEGAMQHAIAYAMDRKQGRTPLDGTPEGTGTILDHADVRRMVATMKADTFAARAIALACGVGIDMTAATGDKAWTARAAFLTPIAKAFGTDTGMAVAEMGVQVHGGMGFIEETGAAQYSRDVRVTAIYEGTNGIQAMDLVARKMMDGGEAANRLLDEIEADAEAARDVFPNMTDALWQASETLREATDWLTEQSNMDTRFAGAVPYLRAFARVLGAHMHLKAALADKGGPREKLARFYILRLLPEHVGLLAHAQAGEADLFALSADELAA